jgi:hypothetical protein
MHGFGFHAQAHMGAGRTWHSGKPSPAADVQRKHVREQDTVCRCDQSYTVTYWSDRSWRAAEQTSVTLQRTRASEPASAASHRALRAQRNAHHVGVLEDDDRSRLRLRLLRASPQANRAVERTCRVAATCRGMAPGRPAFAPQRHWRSRGPATPVAGPRQEQRHGHGPASSRRVQAGLRDRVCSAAAVP